MFAAALLLMLTTTIFAVDSTIAGCSFDEESHSTLCAYRQGQDDDFDWQQISTYMWPDSPTDLPQGSFMMINSSRQLGGQRAQLLLPPLIENDTHCIQFSYYIYAGNDHSPGDLQVYIKVDDDIKGFAVWNISGSQGQQWHQVELAVSTYWPSEYQVIFEATVSEEKSGYIAIDDIVLLNYPCYNVPHLSWLGEMEVNVGQNTTIQCVASGKISESDSFLLEKRNGSVMVPSELLRLGQRRLMATFHTEARLSGHDFYRCITLSSHGAAVSNFGEMIVKGQPRASGPPLLLRAGATHLIIQLNTDAIVGDGPVIQRQIQYHATNSTWTETHAVPSATYKVWHLEPDTEYHLRIVLTRPGEGGTGLPGPSLIAKTKCAEPIRAIQGLTATEIQPRQLDLQWESYGYNLTRCHNFWVSLCYRYSTPAGFGNATISECFSLDRNAFQFRLKYLPPFCSIHIHLALANPEGRKESSEVTFMTEEDIPGVVAKESLVFTALEDMIIFKWEEPSEPNGIITQYEISYQIVASSDPNININSPRRTVYKLRNETLHNFTTFHPGTTYLVSIRARTSKGFGPTTSSEFTTNSSAPLFEYERVPPPLTETENTITVLLQPASAQGSPVSAYQVVVVDETRYHEMVRDTGRPDCFSTSTSYTEAQTRGGPWYYTAELAPDSLPEMRPFIVGDNLTYSGYWNVPLDPTASYLIYLQAASHARGEVRVNCFLIATKVAWKDSKQAMEVSQHAEDIGLILGVCFGGPLVLVLLLSVSIFIKKRSHFSSYFLRKHLTIKRSPMCYKQQAWRQRGERDQSSLLPEELMGHSIMETREEPSSISECSSPLGGSPQHHVPLLYHTGQLHPAVRVNDLFQHISLMKTANGYSFKEEYESFFNGRDHLKKKRNYDRHRVKLHPILTDPAPDSITANFFDGYQRPNRFIATEGPTEETINHFWRMVWQENCITIVMITRLVEMGRVKCCKYWPDDSEVYGDIKISLLATETLADYSVRTFALERRGYPTKHEVRHFLFTSWPEHGVPAHATSLLAFLRRVKASTPPDAGPVMVHCSSGAGRTGCYIVLDIMLDMAECEGVVDIYNCVKTLCARQINMIQSEEQYVFIHNALLEACLCGETGIPVCEFPHTFKEMLKVDSQSNTSHLREEFQTLASLNAHLDVDEGSHPVVPWKRDRLHRMEELQLDLTYLVSTEDESKNCIHAERISSFLRPEAFVVMSHPQPGSTDDFWRLVYDDRCTTVVMLNQMNQSTSTWRCLPYWPDHGIQQSGLMRVELLSMTYEDDSIVRLFHVWKTSQAHERPLAVHHFQFLRWSPYRDVPTSKRAFLGLLEQVLHLQMESGEGRTLVHCLNGGGQSGVFCICTSILEMIRHHNTVDVFFSAKTVCNAKPNMLETMEQYQFCYELVQEALSAWTSNSTSSSALLGLP
ncbi:receptor-type tyrosine-protein phosphatase U [Synchiropus splendidus]|uniref:receptor-type tyrosine-protein phosphatase U n=1 Tax=Synchiropus splendidus TaxID=270530 RepID=UPI00237E61DA|nr:receptor-type tyrosine-protein phosphatase U [Synchiropus splendidus]